MQLCEHKLEEQLWGRFVEEDGSGALAVFAAETSTISLSKGFLGFSHFPSYPTKNISILSAKGNLRTCWKL